MDDFLLENVQPEPATEQFLSIPTRVHNRLEDECAAWITEGNEPFPTTCFIAQSPGSALLWMCENATQQQLLRTVKDLYKDHGIGLNREDSDPGISTQPSRKRNRRGDPAQPSNKTLQRRKAKERKIVKLADVWEKSGDEIENSDREIVPEREPFVNHLKGLGGLGLAQTAELARRGSEVAGRRAFEDFSIMMKMWRSKEGGLVEVFGPSTQLPTTFLEEPERMDMNRVTNEGEDSQTLEIARNPVVPTLFDRRQDFAAMFFATLNHQGRTIADEYKYRWMLATLHIRVKTIEEEIRCQEDRNAGVGRGYASTARDQLAKDLAACEGRPTQVLQDLYRKQLNRMLEKGRRWHILQEYFGDGIFIMIPATNFPRSFVEKKSPEVLSIWCDMVKRVRPEVVQLSKEAHNIFTRLLKAQSPPEIQLRFELIPDEEWDSVQGDMQLLLQEGVSGSMEL